MPYNNFRNWVNAGFGQYSVVSGTALSFSTIALPAGTSMALLAVSNNPINWRDDGTAPTTGVGMPLSSGQEMSYQGQFNKLQMICSLSSSVAIVSASYYT